MTEKGEATRPTIFTFGALAHAKTRSVKAHRELQISKCVSSWEKELDKRLTPQRVVSKECVVNGKWATKCKVWSSSSWDVYTTEAAVDDGPQCLFQLPTMEAHETALDRITRMAKGRYEVSRVVVARGWKRGDRWQDVEVEVVIDAPEDLRPMEQCGGYCD